MGEEQDEGNRGERGRANNEALKRDQLMQNCAASLQTLTGHTLSEDEWKCFEQAIDRLISDLGNIANNRERSRHPTTNWRRRQRRSKTNEPSQESSTTQDTSLQDRSLLSNQSQPTPQEGTDPPHSSQARRRRQHNRSEARKRAKEVGKLQRWYRANKKKCIRSILGEQSPRCEIPLEELTNHFSVELPPPPTSPPPTHLPERRESYDPDELTFPVEPTEVHKQLKRLPSKSAPGPDGVTYDLWKSSEVAPTLLATVYSICYLNK